MISPEELTERSSALGNLMTGAERWFTTITESQLSEKDRKSLAIYRTKNESGKELTDRQKVDFESIKKRLTEPVEPKLSAGAITHLQNRFMGEMFSWQKSVTSRPMTKGNIVEERAIDQLGKFLCYSFPLKNLKHYSDAWTHGTPDYTPPPAVFDTKCVWEPAGLKVFSLGAKGEDLMRTYTWQVKDYCRHTGKDKGAVARILMSLPESQLESVSRSYWIDAGGSWREQIPDNFINEVRDMFDFETKMPFEDRLSLTFIPFDDDDDRRIKTAVELAREVWENLLSTWNQKNIHELKMLGYVA